jgi:hypothetical protein
MVTHRADERAFWQERIGGVILSLPGAADRPRRFVATDLKPIA